MNIIAWLNFFGDLLADESRHFLLAFSAGALAYWLTSTTYSVGYSALRRWTRWRGSMVVDYGIHICLVLLAISLALLSHYYLDYFTSWYNAPLAPPLELMSPGG